MQQTGYLWTEQNYSYSSHYIDKSRKKQGLYLCIPFQTFVIYETEYKVFFVSGRENTGNCCEKTKQWLSDKNIYEYFTKFWNDTQIEFLLIQLAVGKNKIFLLSSIIDVK